MAETAAHLVDHVLPHKNIRQWVLTFPVPIRLCLAVRPKVMARALEISHLVTSQYYRKKAGLGAKNSKSGAVTLIQRFGGSLNLNIHFHQLFVDGCYELSDKNEPIDFWVAAPPTVSEIEAKNSGFSLHAGVATKVHERDRLEKICRYIARPAVSEERLSTDDYGNVIYRFKKPWDDGTTALKLTPMELMERLVALVPRPRVHLTRYHGVLGPHYKHRKQIVPKPPALKLVTDDQISVDPKQLELKKKNIPWARLLARVFNIDVETCIKCGGKMKIIAAIEDPKVIRKILEHMGLDTKPPPL